MTEKELMEEAKKGESLAKQGKVTDIDISESLKRFELAAKAGAFEKDDKLIVFWRLILSESKNDADYAATLASKTFDYLDEIKIAREKLNIVSESVNKILKEFGGKPIEEFVNSFCCAIFNTAYSVKDKNIINIAIKILQHLYNYAESPRERMVELAHFYGGDDYKKFEEESKEKEKDRDKIFLIMNSGNIRAFYATRKGAQNNLMKNETIEEKIINLE